MPAETKTFIRQRVTLATSSPPGKQSRNSEIKNGERNVKQQLKLGLADSLPVQGSYPIHSALKGSEITEENESSEMVDLLSSSEREHFTNSRPKKIDFAKNAHAINSSELMHSALKTDDHMTGGGVLRYALHARFLCCSKSVKDIRQCRSDLSATSERNDATSEAKRRFYLYNDLRVVFPQRQSDSDEGKLHVEHHFPADPKYFDISY